jgi:serine protein kinase
MGASAREIRTLILNAAHHPDHRCLTPLPIFEELRELVRDPTIYTFLKQEPREGYHDSARFIDQVEEWWLDLFDEEFRTSMGLVEEAQHEQLFAKYVTHASHHVKKAKLLDKVTGRYLPADEDMMREVERVLLAEGEDREEFRRAVIGRIGAWGLENAGQTPNYRKLFPRYIEKMEVDYYRRQRKVITKNIKNVLDVLQGEVRTTDEKEIEIADRTITRMKERYGYERECTAECAAYLLKKRYAETDRQ